MPPAPGPFPMQPPLLSSVPIGSILQFALDPDAKNGVAPQTASRKWLLCDGSNVTLGQFPALNRIGQGPPINTYMYQKLYFAVGNGFAGMAYLPSVGLLLSCTTASTGVAGSMQFSSDLGVSFSSQIIPTMGANCQVSCMNAVNGFFAIGNSNANASASMGAYSSTGLTGSWTAMANSSTANTQPACFAFGASLYVAVGPTAVNIQTATTIGGAWTSRDTSGNFRWVKFANSLFVVVGDSGSIKTSPDGITWTARTSGVSNVLRGVDYDSTQGLWMAVGSSGTVITSPDAITWTQKSPPYAYTLSAVVALNGYFYVNGETDNSNNGDFSFWRTKSGASWLPLSGTYRYNESVGNLATDGSNTLFLGRSPSSAMTVYSGRDAPTAGQFTLPLLGAGYYMRAAI